MPLPSHSRLDYHLGMDWYVTDTSSIGGKLRTRPEDFTVIEICKDGKTVLELEYSDKLGSWCWIVIEKRSIDTISTAILLSRKLGIGLRDITYAGLKDSNALTYQIYSVRNVSIDFLRSIDLGVNVKIKKILIADKPFTSSEIFGNFFIIRVKDIEGNADRIDECISQVLSRGLPNYYGYQRFGIKRPNSHIIGKFIIQRKFEEAIHELISHKYSHEDDRVLKAREHAEKGNYLKALEYFPKSIKYLPERLVLKHLCTNPKDYVGALRRMPKDLLKLYIESYQSYLFNKFLSERLRRNLPINRAVPGDLVVLLDEYGLPTRHVVKVSESMVDKVNELILKGRYALALTLPGYNSKIQDTTQGDVELKVLKEERIDLSMFKVKAIPEISLKGGYRLASIKPLSISWKIEHHDLIISFKLVRGSYATILIRELMKPEDPLSSGF